MGINIITITLRLPLLRWFQQGQQETWERFFRKRERERAGNGGGVSLRGGEQMESQPPLPICAEGEGGTQLLGSRGHCLVQRTWPILPGRAAILASTSPPDPYRERSGEGVGRGRVKRRRERWSGGNSKSRVNGPPLPPLGLERPKRKGTTPITAQSSLPPVNYPLQVYTTTVTCKASQVHILTQPQPPTPHVHHRHLPTCAQGTSLYPHTVTWCTDGHAHTSPPQDTQCTYTLHTH